MCVSAVCLLFSSADESIVSFRVTRCICLASFVSSSSESRVHTETAKQTERDGKTHTGNEHNRFGTATLYEKRCRVGCSFAHQNQKVQIVDAGGPRRGRRWNEWGRALVHDHFGNVRRAFIIRHSVACICIYIEEIRYTKGRKESKSKVSQCVSFKLVYTSV